MSRSSVIVLPELGHVGVFMGVSVLKCGQESFGKYSEKLTLTWQ